MVKQKKVTSIVVLTVILVALMVSMVFAFSAYVRRSVHDERVVYLSSQTDSVADLIDSIIAQYADYAESCAYLISEELQEGDDIALFMDEVQAKLYRSDTRLILVDSNCTWYAANNNYGRITAPEEYGRNTADQTVYMTMGCDVNVESMVFRVRLAEPITVNTDQGEASICFAAVICYMDVMQERFAAAFPYTCNSFICDETGLMLFKDLPLGLLIEGSNAITKMQRVQWYYASVSDLIDTMNARETMVGELVIRDTDYFFCVSPLSTNNWFAAFIFPSEALTAGNYIRTISIYMALLALIFASAIAITASALLRYRQSQAIVAQQERANVLLEQASKAKSDFLSNMSHDIRTPINGIMGMTALARKQENNPRTDDCLRKIHVSAEYLLSLVNDVLDMSSIESGKVSITTAPMNLPAFLDGCISIINGQLQDRQLNIVTDFSDISHPDVLADELHLRQIFMNILSNAVKFTPDGGTISVTAQEQSNPDGTVSTVFTLSDTGEGMSEEFLQNIWDRFSQAENGSRSKFKGTGLGMAITKRLVELMDGTIEVQSALGKGSTFTVTLPLQPTEAPKAEITESGEIAGCRILLAEDNEINMEIAIELLSDEGAIVTPAENGRKALDTFRDNPPGTFDIILLDIMMPEMNGLECARAIRALERNDARRIPILAMTANAFDDDIRATKEAGMNAHLTKPIDIVQVVRTISQFTGKE